MIESKVERIQNVCSTIEKMFEEKRHVKNKIAKYKKLIPAIEEVPDVYIDVKTSNKLPPSDVKFYICTGLGTLIRSAENDIEVLENKIIEAFESKPKGL